MDAIAGLCVCGGVDGENNIAGRAGLVAGTGMSPILESEAVPRAVSTQIHTLDKLLTTKRSSLVFAKYALLFPPRLAHLQHLTGRAKCEALYCIHTVRHALLFLGPLAAHKVCCQCMDARYEYNFIFHIYRSFYTFPYLFILVTKACSPPCTHRRRSSRN